MANISRRCFLGGAAAFAGLTGCTSLRLAGGKPSLTFGVISDIHITTPESTALLERTFRAFRDSKADAVMICGDLSDWGLRSGLEYLAATWNRVFPNNKGIGGRPVQKLFCTGNHDYEGWWYGDMTMEMHALGYFEDEALIRLGMKQCWESIFQEEFAPIRRRSVNGYDFISAEWYGRDKTSGFDQTDAWLKANGSGLDPSRPFFYFQHPPPAGTTSSSGGGDMQKKVSGALAAFPNAVSFSGHTHWTLNDARSIWQGAYTAVSVPSMSYTTVPGSYENGGDARNGKSVRSMPKIPARFNLEEAQGFFVSVYSDRIELERHDFTRQKRAGESWIVPLPMTKERKPYTFAAHSERTPVPQFPAGADLQTFTRNTETRSDKWEIVMVCDFPTATCGIRAFDYEIRAVPTDRSAPMVKRFLSPAFHKLPQDEPARMRFYFNVEDLPQDKEYRIEVYPRNCFGKCGKPLVSAPRRGKPGKASAIPLA
ncbi:MAG: metallophosphoesterase [Kiritimatiellae bacterium]|nr:metallophosphoesterase [Kiritimatiellia bacterium]